MHYEWLKRREGARDLIIVFGGWAIGPSVFSHLRGEADILFLSDYRDLLCDLPDLSAYENRFMIAWSFGVAAFGHWQHNNDMEFKRKIALCGSPYPIDKKLGIHPVIFKRTIESLDDQTYQDFRQRCFNEKAPYQPIDVEERREELLCVQKRGPAPDVLWDKVIIAENDAIFPLKNMESAFADNLDKIVKLQSAHVPFSHFKTWQEVLF